MKYIYVIIWIVLVIVLSLLPKDSIEIESVRFFKGFDKIIHFFMYAIMMFLWIRIIRYNKMYDKSKWILFGMFFSIGLGIILEILQKYLEIGRSFDIFDIITNITGVLFVVIFFNNKI